MKNRFTTIVIATIVAISVSLLAFTSKSSMVGKKATVTAVCPLDGKADCSKSMCPSKGTSDCSSDKTVPDCCKDKK